MSDQLLFSVVIPTHNRPQALRRVLRSVAEQDLPRDLFELIVVDDGSRMDLEPIVSQCARGLRARLIRQANLGQSAARNRGGLAARGRYLAFTDDDCRPVPGWLSALRMACERHPNAICGGPVADGKGGGIYSQATIMLHDYLHGSYNPAQCQGGYYSANNLCVPQKGFAELGGFDVGMRLGEDRELCYRWTARKGRFSYAPGAIVEHYHRQNLVSFGALHFSYGQGTGLFRQLARLKGLDQVNKSSLRWYLELVLFGVKRQPGRRGLLLSALLLYSQAANVFGILCSKLRQRRIWKDYLALREDYARYCGSADSDRSDCETP